MAKGKIPGTFSKQVLPHLGAIKLGVDNNRLTALICALIDAAGGSVTLTKAQVDRVWIKPEILYVKGPNGSLVLSLKDYTPTPEPADPLPWENVNP